MSAGIWTTLGLKRTDDVAEIRRAYARKLKATDVDADPAAFIALREALERALAYAARRQKAGEPEMQDPAWDEPDLAFAPAYADMAPPPEPVDAVPADGGEDPGARFRRLEALLFTPDERERDEYVFPDPAELADALREVLEHPEMDSVDQCARVEVWLAQLLYDAVPRSDPVLATAVDWFGWENRAGAWDQPWLLEELAARRRAFRFLDEVATPGHPLHKAWLDLTSDGTSLGLRSIRRTEEVATLLRRIREECPAAEGALDAYRVSLWDARLGKTVQSRLGWAIAIFWLLFIVARVVQQFDGSAPTPAPVTVATGPVYTDPATDLDPFIAAASMHRLTLAELEQVNPALHERLIDRWREARASGPGIDYMFAGDVRTLLDEAYRESLRGGGYELQSAYWRLYADRLIWLRSHDFAACDRQIRGDSVALVPPATFEQRRRELAAEALEQPVPPTPRATRTRFAIPESLFREAARRSGLADPALDAALNGGGTPAERCNARIAIIEAALAQPRPRASAFLRDMSAGL